MKAVKKLSDEVIDRIRQLRYRARTDLVWLANRVLEMPDVNRKTHGPMIASLQSFPLPPYEECKHCDVWNGRGFEWRNPIPMLELPGRRRRLILDFRGSLKTSINIIAHTIQWIINYPDVALLVVHTSTEKAEIVVNRIRSIFQYNQVFRSLFPEMVPASRVADFGSRGSFTVPGRSRECTHVEPTVMSGGMNKSLSGLHFDVIKFTDVVDEETIRGSGLQDTIESFYLKQNLLVSPLYWIDVEGTRYHFSDLYGRIIDEWKHGHRDFWQIYLRGVFKRAVENPRFDPDELEAPFLLDEKGKRVPWWPERYPLSYLEEMERSDSYMFSCQMLNNPALDAGRSVFPVNDEYPKWIRRADFLTNVRVADRVMCVDLAETVGDKSNHSAITVAAWDVLGRVYAEHVIVGRMTPEEIVTTIYNMYSKYRPSQVRIEETGYTRGLMPTILRQGRIIGINLPIDLVKRDTHTSKVERIHRTLQPWYVRGDLIFLEDLGDPGHPDSALNTRVKERLLLELSRFPLFAEDDILDTLSDVFQKRSEFGPVGDPSEAKPEIRAKREWERFLGIQQQSYNEVEEPGIPYSRKE